MMSRRRRRATLPGLDVPEGVWEIIASHMSLKHWAKASGTNFTTFTVNLHKVHIPAGTPIAGFFTTSATQKKQHCRQFAEIMQMMGSCTVTEATAIGHEILRKQVACRCSMGENEN